MKRLSSIRLSFDNLFLARCAESLWDYTNPLLSTTLAIGNLYVSATGCLVNAQMLCHSAESWLPEFLSFPVVQCHLPVNLVSIYFYFLPIKIQNACALVLRLFSGLYNQTLRFYYIVQNIFCPAFIQFFHVAMATIEQTGKHSINRSRQRQLPVIIGGISIQFQLTLFMRSVKRDDCWFYNANDVGDWWIHHSFSA